VMSKEISLFYQEGIYKNQLKQLGIEQAQQSNKLQRLDEIERAFYNCKKGCEGSQSYLNQFLNVEHQNQNAQISNSLLQNGIATISIHNGQEVFSLVLDIKQFQKSADFQNCDPKTLDPTLKNGGCQMNAFYLLNLLKGPKINAAKLSLLKFIELFNDREPVFCKDFFLENAKTSISQELYNKFEANKIIYLSEGINALQLAQQQNLKKELGQKLLYTLREIAIQETQEFFLKSLQAVDPILSQELSCAAQLKPTMFQGSYSGNPTQRVIQVLNPLGIAKGLMQMCTEALLKIYTFKRNASGAINLEYAQTSLIPIKIQKSKLSFGQFDKNLPVLTYTCFRLINDIDSKLPKEFQITDPMKFAQVLLDETSKNGFGFMEPVLFVETDVMGILAKKEVKFAMLHTTVSTYSIEENFLSSLEKPRIEQKGCQDTLLAYLKQGVVTNNNQLITEICKTSLIQTTPIDRLVSLILFKHTNTPVPPFLEQLQIEFSSMGQTMDEFRKHYYEKKKGAQTTSQMISKKIMQIALQTKIINDQIFTQLDEKTFAQLQHFQQTGTLFESAGLFLQQNPAFIQQQNIQEKPTMMEVKMSNEKQGQIQGNMVFHQDQNQDQNQMQIQDEKTQKQLQFFLDTGILFNSAANALEHSDEIGRPNIIQTVIQFVADGLQIVSDGLNTIVNQQQLLQVESHM